MNNPVSYNLAKLLKEKGFDEGCNIHYSTLYENIPDLKHNYFKTVKKDKNSELINYITAPTIGEVVMWIYEKDKVWINVGVYNSKFYFRIIPNNIPLKERELQYKRLFDYPTEAYEAAIEHYLKNLIK